ncbi:hypothetical protein Pgy4_40030, partial [Pseudomonas savastanoi pv. glycinea str. race 4]
NEEAVARAIDACVTPIACIRLASPRIQAPYGRCCNRNAW